MTWMTSIIFLLLQNSTLHFVCLLHKTLWSLWLQRDKMWKSSKSFWKALKLWNFSSNHPTFVMSDPLCNTFSQCKSCLIKDLNPCRASHRSSLLMYVSCWGSQRPRGVAASLTLVGAPWPCFWSKRAGRASARTASPTQLFLQGLHQWNPNVNHSSKGAKQSHVSVIWNHTLSAGDDVDETLTAYRSQAGLDINTSKQHDGSFVAKQEKLFNGFLPSVNTKIIVALLDQMCGYWPEIFFGSIYGRSPNTWALTNGSRS